MRSLAIADLERSGITPSDAEACQLWDVPDASQIYPDFRAEPAVVIPYFNPNGSLMMFEREGVELPFCRVRYLDPPQQARGFVGTKSPPKYGQPGKSGTHAYFPPNVGVPWAKLLQDAQEPVIITEGEKKAIAAAAAGFPVIALGGVFNFAQTGEDLLPELAVAKWRGKDAYLCFDSDRVMNANIRAAEARLVDELHKRGARCHLVELPPEDDKKVGLDDFLLMYGAKALEGLLSAAVPLGALDAKVVSLNRRIAWIDREGCAYDLGTRQFISKDNLVSGHEISSIKHITVAGKQRSQPKVISVAATWLTHRLAQRFPEILFRPGLGPIVESETGSNALNMWNGWRAESGIKPTDKRVSAFLELTEFLFQNMEPQDRELPLKLMAWKAQHPMDKVPLALVLIGDQGCGKSLFGECLIHAFHPYGVAIDSKEFDAEFQGWMEHSVLAVINEAKAHHLQMYGEALKALISDKRRNMNEKFRPKRQIDSYTMYVLTANDRAVGSFDADDRRMIVVDCPPKLTDAAGQELYRYLGERHGEWVKTGGPAALMGYLLELDLGDWRPPYEAPMTAEKATAYRESLSLIQELAAEMRCAEGNAVRQWIDAAVSWAREAETSSNPGLAAAARATLDGVKHMQMRPFYEPRELALMFPAVAGTVLGGKFDKNTTPGKISRDLRNAGIKYLRNRDNPSGFKWKGQVRQYLIVCEQDEWASGLTQAEFDRVMSQFEFYGKGLSR